jgi:hypothetical protein
MCTPIERLRCVLQRNTPGAAPCKCGVVVVPAKRYKDRYGHVVILLELNRNTVLFRRAGGDLCKVNRRVFERDFRKVEE